MSLLDENIEPSFDTLLESLDWFKVVRRWGSISYTYSGLDCAGRYFGIEFFPKGYISKVVSGNFEDTIVKKLRKDQWNIYYQQDYYSNSTGDMYYTRSSCNIRMDRENVIQLMNDIKNRTFNPKNYKVVKK